ncbi:MAG TPA: sigma 54-interacting transcriptional regulator [Thermoanaerobaculia bacterium]|nr:sigma 54-interacting transcriptional regulator [Thermoanaerobaculia bacterium]
MSSGEIGTTIDTKIDLTVELPAQRDGAERRGRARTLVPALTILGHPDPSRVGERRALPSLQGGGVCRLSRLELDFASPQGGLARPLADPYLSRSPIVLAGLGGGAIRLVVEGSRTPVGVDGEAVADRVELSATEVADGVVIELSRRVVLLLHQLQADTTPDPRRFGLVGDSDAIEHVRREIARVADLEVPVLVRGETGTGKELVAKAIHQVSRRSQGAFLSVNLAAVPATLAASELFGVIKGSFTGADHAQVGYFQRADKGTLFLDEVGDAPSEVQASLLRVLETGEIQRVGAQTPQKVDVRLLAATDLDLEEAIDEGDFRAPLLHRLAGYEIVAPPLRARRDDFGRLFFHFLREELAAVGEPSRLDLDNPKDTPWMPASIVARLARHDWPGNVRQVKNVARQLAVAGRGSKTARVTPQVDRLLREAEAGPASGVHPAETVKPKAEPARKPPPPTSPSFRSPSEVTEDELIDALRAHRWQVKPAAEALGVARPSMYALIERSKSVRKVSDLSEEEIAACHGECDGDLEAMVDRLEVSKDGLRQRIAQMEIG